MRNTKFSEGIAPADVTASLMKFHRIINEWRQSQAVAPASASQGWRAMRPNAGNPIFPAALLRPQRLRGVRSRIGALRVRLGF